MRFRILAPYLVLAAVLAAGCNNANFAGGSGSKSDRSTKGNGDGGKDGDNGKGGDGNGGDGANGTDSADNGDGSGGNGGDKDNGLATGDGALNNPCAGQADAQNTLGTSAPAAKSLLFYAPASYSTQGGGEATSNLFLNGIVSGMQADGWNIKVITTVQDSGISFDACSLHKAYRQIWLWLPCNSPQNMDDASFAGVTKYFDYGGGVVVMTDNHYKQAGNANTHCSPSDWGGTAGTPSDAIRLAQHMGFTLTSGAGGGANGTVDATHPLSQALSSLTVDSFWTQNTISAAPAGAVYLPYNGKANYAGLIDQTKAPPKGAQPKLGLILTSMYKYHVGVSSGKDDVKALEAVASYFDANVQVSAAAAGTSLALTGGRAAFNPKAYHSSFVRKSPLELRTLLATGEKDETATALRELAAQGEITLGDLLAYNDDNRWLVRFSAAMAAGDLPHPATVPTLVAKLVAGPLTPDLAIFCARALAVQHATEALPALKAAAATFAGAPVVMEHDVQAELGAAIRELSSLQ